MMKYYEVYKEIWRNNIQISKYFIQTLFLEEKEVFEEILEINWPMIEDWHKRQHMVKGLYITKIKEGYVIALSEKLFSRETAKAPIIKQWEEPELDLQVRYRCYEVAPSIEDIVNYPNKEKISQWLREQGVEIRG